MTIDLQDKLYTSTQVADILGVSLRTLYRYMEDGRIQSMRTASGRHRFTKDHITDFLNAGNLDPQDLLRNDSLANSSQDFSHNSATDLDDDFNNDFGQFNRNVNTNQKIFETGQAGANQLGRVVNAKSTETPVDTQGFNNISQYDNTYQQDNNRFNQTQTRSPYQGYSPSNVVNQNSGASGFQSQYNNQQGGDFNRQKNPVVDQYQNPFEERSLQSRQTDPVIEDLEDDVFFSPSSNNSFTSKTARSFDSTPFNQGNQTKQEFTDQKNAFTTNRYDPFMPNVNPNTNANPSTNANTNTNFGANYDDNIDQIKKADHQQPDRFAKWPEVDDKFTMPVEKKLEPAEKFVSRLNIRYYKSEITDLLELARKIKEVGKSRDLEYAFTLYAGLSLHFFIKPFTTLHFYANPEDMQIWREDLRLNPVQNKEDANIGILVNTDIIFVPNKDIAGFRVIEDKLLMKDLAELGEEDLVKTFRQHLMSN